MGNAGSAGSAARQVSQPDSQLTVLVQALQSLQCAAPQSPFPPPGHPAKPPSFPLHFTRKRQFSRAAYRAADKWVMQGVLGLGQGKSADLASSVAKAYNRAMERLFFIPRFRDHTIYAKRKSKYGRALVYIYPKPAGAWCECAILSKPCSAVLF